jgi:hypothetical protein
LRRLSAAALVGVTLAVSGCRAKKSEPAAGPPPSAGFADGAKLARSLDVWRARWRSETSPPDCTPLLASVDEQKLCRDAASALERVKARADAADASNAALTDGAELARTAAEAARKLRFRDMEYMGREGMALGSARPAGSVLPPGSASARPQAPRAAASALDAGTPPPGVRHDDPYQPAVRAYAKLEAEALRYLGSFLELGSLPVRRAAFNELRKLWPETSRPSHPLQQVIRQASLLETDPELKAQIQKLDAKSHLAPPEARP